MRRTRSSVEDRWTKSIHVDGKTVKVPSANAGKGKRYRARYVDKLGTEHAKGFDLKRDAQIWLESQVSTVVTGTHVAARDAQTTVQQWCDTWLEGYASKRPNTVRCAKVHIAQITKEFGGKQLNEIRASQIKSWTARLKADGHQPSYIYSLHRRLTQILADAQYDGLLGRNPCSRKTAPERGKQKPYVATTEQIWAIYDAMPDRYRAAVLLGAFAGLRVAEVAGLRVADVNFMAGIVHPKVQYGDKPLKTDGSDAPIPVPRELTLMLSASVKKYGTDHMVTNATGKPCKPWDIEHAIQNIRGQIDGLPAKFTFHDFRHYFASLLIADGADIKTVQARLRHASASTTLDTYSHLWPDADESTRTAVGKVIKARR
ncbi:MAG TPA: site-specific integrase, partial [Mycobacterium sp.]|nr:site-specific integrase [Mycobacterium sp.]